MHLGFLEASAFLPGAQRGVCSFHFHHLSICYRALSAKRFSTHWEGDTFSMILYEGRERVVQVGTADFSFSVASLPHACPHLTLIEHLLCANDKEQDRLRGFGTVDCV